MPQIYLWCGFLLMNGSYRSAPFSPLLFYKIRIVRVRFRKTDSVSKRIDTKHLIIKQEHKRPNAPICGNQSSLQTEAEQCSLVLRRNCPFRISIRTLYIFVFFYLNFPLTCPCLCNPWPSPTLSIHPPSLLKIVKKRSCFSVRDQSKQEITGFCAKIVWHHSTWIQN